MFELGKVYTTIQLETMIKEDKHYLEEILGCLQRYIGCDFGNLCKSDIKANIDAIKEQSRILATYDTTYGKIYIITESNRLATTIMFAEEY